eukprot:scaffold17854_cov124-Isochrysis_galbana.AAC.8
MPSITFSRMKDRMPATPSGMHARSSASSSASESSSSPASASPVLTGSAQSACRAPPSRGSAPSRPPPAAAPPPFSGPAASLPRSCECHSIEWTSICALSERSRVLSWASRSSRNSRFPPGPLPCPSGMPSHESPMPSRKSSCLPMPCTRNSRCCSLLTGPLVGAPTGANTPLAWRGADGSFFSSCRLSAPSLAAAAAGSAASTMR